VALLTAGMVLGCTNVVILGSPKIKEDQATEWRIPSNGLPENEGSIVTAVMIGFTMLK